MRTPIPQALVRPLHVELVAILAPEIGEHPARQASAHALTVLACEERVGVVALLRGYLMISHRPEHGGGPELSVEEASKLAVECYLRLSAACVAHDLTVRLAAVRRAGRSEVAA